MDDTMFMKLSKKEKTILSVLCSYRGKTYRNIQEKTNESEETVKKALCTLIQKKYVTHTMYRDMVLYFKDSKVVNEIKFHFIYLYYAQNNYEEGIYKLFDQILFEGISLVKKETKELQFLLNEGVVNHEYVAQSKKDVDEKQNKLSSLFYSINYDILKKKVCIDLVAEIIKKDFGCELCKVYKIIALYNLDQEIVVKEDIIGKIQGETMCSLNNIKNAIKYLQGMGFINEEFKSKNFESDFLQQKYIDFILTDTSQKRLYHMCDLFYRENKRNVTDKDITFNSLLPLVCQKASVLELQAKGLLLETCTDVYKIRQKVDHFYRIDKEYTRKCVLKKIEKEVLGNIGQEYMCKLIFLYFVFHLSFK
ncbi:hypothetical protein EHP00_1033 [Ecytonucleospora hepatopenaei]|uniref:RNA polymerase III subunit C3 n=1 Tax=Ecytonucleospora hepatopenaei TaxID=646526 RepID=A0A1W0E526_9MICR|nr:hypothetical protein EHP00_1033 [Ecytonucleospora hepatopenaei]